jgi:hypothetical protein
VFIAYDKSKITCFGCGKHACPSAFNASGENCYMYVFRLKTKNTIIYILKIRTELDKNGKPPISWLLIMANPVSQMLKNISKLVCMSLFFLNFHHIEPFSSLSHQTLV